MDISINKLAEITAKSRRTIKSKIFKAGLKPIATGATDNPLWDSMEVLPLLYDTPDIETDRQPGLSAENIRLISLRADAQAMKNAELRSGLIPASKVDETWQRIVTAVELEFKGWPERVAEKLKAASKRSDRKKIIDNEMKKSLNKLADIGAKITL